MPARREMGKNGPGESIAGTGREGYDSRGREETRTGEDGYGRRRAQRKEGGLGGFAIQAFLWRPVNSIYLLGRALRIYDPEAAPCPPQDGVACFPLLHACEQLHLTRSSYGGSLLYEAPSMTRLAEEDGVAVRSTVFLMGIAQPEHLRLHTYIENTLTGNLLTARLSRHVLGHRCACRA